MSGPFLKTALIGACAPQARFQMLSLQAAEDLARAKVTAFEAKIVQAVVRLGEGKHAGAAFRA